MQHRLLTKCIIAAMGIISMAALSACGNSSNQQSEADTIGNPITFADSLSVALGSQWGAMQNIDFHLLPDEKAKNINIDKFMEGLEKALTIDISNPATFEGLRRGADIAAQIDQYIEVGIPMKHTTVKNAIATSLLNDTIPSDQLSKIQDDLDSRLSIVQNIILEKIRQQRRQQMLKSQQIKNENIKAAREYLQSIMKDDPSIQTTQTGLSYKIIEPGTGQKPTNGATLQMVYSIKAIDGHTIDSSRGEIVDVPFDSTMIEGLRQGVNLISVGGKATLYIPSDLGFVREVNGISPGEMIIVQFELKGFK